MDLERAAPATARAGTRAALLPRAPSTTGCAARPNADRDDAFLRLWCAKEAVLKAHGHGISFGLDKLRFADANGGAGAGRMRRRRSARRDWSLHEFEPRIRLSSPRWPGAAAAAMRARMTVRRMNTPHLLRRPAPRTRSRPARARPRRRARRAAARLPRPARALEPDLQPHRHPRPARDGRQAPARLAGDAPVSCDGVGTPGRPRHRRRPARHPAGDRQARRCR